MIFDRSVPETRYTPALFGDGNAKACPLTSMEEEMRRSIAKRNDGKRLDAMIALPMARFRRTLADLTPDELSALAARLAVQIIRSRWARGGHGVARHRSLNELGLLARRQVALRREIDSRRGATAQLRLIEFDPAVREVAAPDLEDRAA